MLGLYYQYAVKWSMQLDKYAIGQSMHITDINGDHQI